MAFRSLLFASASCIATAAAQTFSFVGAPVPGTSELRTYYTFLVHSVDDASDRRFGGAIVRTRLQLVADEKASQPAAASELSNYESLQVALLPQVYFFALVDPLGFCATNATGGAPELHLRRTLPGAFVHTVSAHGVQEHHANLADTGAYVLVLCNCGPLQGIKVDGTVSVRNPHGFLSPTDFGKMAFHKGLLVFYVVVSAVWMSILARAGEVQVLDIHIGIMATSCIGALEGAFSWWWYAAGNDMPQPPSFIRLLSAVASLWKVCVAFRTVLLVARRYDDVGDSKAAGWWNLDRRTSVAFLLYATADFNFRLTLSRRAGYAVQAQEVLLNALPALTLGAALLGWGGVALSQRALALEARGLKREASLFRRSLAILGATALGALLAVIAQTLDVTCGEDGRLWSRHYLVSDGLPQGVFAAALASAMAVWAPARVADSATFGPTEDEECRPIGMASAADGNSDSAAPLE